MLSSSRPVSVAKEMSRQCTPEVGGAGHPNTRRCRSSIRCESSWGWSFAPIRAFVFLQPDESIAYPPYCGWPLSSWALYNLPPRIYQDVRSETLH